MIPDLRKKENLHIVFWLIKDFSWLINFKILGMAMAVPTIFLSIWLTWKSRNHRMDFYHNCAVSSWICGNAIWMYGEFYCDDCSRPFAVPAFVLGFCFIAWYYVTDFIKNRSTSQ